MNVKDPKAPAHKLIEEFKTDPFKLYDYIDFIYDRINRVEPKIKAFITLRAKEHVYEIAENLIKAGMQRGRALKLWGIPIAVKDNISTKGIRTTCASRILENYVPPYDATVIERIVSEGGLVIGKTNMDEFAMGSTTETSAFFPTRNPWSINNVPGGSSGGSAAALASGEVPLALGSDTGGSIRNPAAFTATYGLRPTYGLVSRYGLVAYASSMDQIGPMARNTEDLALLLSVISGFDERDSTSLPLEREDYVGELHSLCFKEPKVKIGVLKDFFEESDEGVKAAAYKALSFLCSYHECVEVSFPYGRQALAAYYIIAMAEASSNLARYDGIRYGIKVPFERRSWIEVYSEVRTKGFGYEVKKRVALGAFVLSMGYRDMYYIRALRFRRMLKEELNRMLRRVDVLVSPTMPILPPRLGEFFEDPVRMYMADVNTVLSSLAGLPAISVPIGFIEGLPVGLQIMSRPLSETLLLYLSRQLEEKTGASDLVAEV